MRYIKFEYKDLHNILKIYKKRKRMQSIDKNIFKEILKHMCLKSIRFVALSCTFYFKRIITVDAFIHCLELPLLGQILVSTGAGMHAKWQDSPDSAKNKKLIILKYMK